MYPSRHAIKQVESTLRTRLTAGGWDNRMLDVDFLLAKTFFTFYNLMLHFARYLDEGKSKIQVYKKMFQVGRVGRVNLNI